LEILVLHHQLGVLQRSVKMTQTDTAGSVVGLAVRHVSRGGRPYLRRCAR
jgi:hypothetical protein